MKNRLLYYAVMLLLGLGIFCSCQKEGIGGKYGTVVGCWVYEDEVDEIDGYYEFTKSGVYKEFDISPYDFIFATFDDGVLYTPKSHHWVEAFATRYDIVDGFFDGDKIDIINKNTIMWGGDILLRVKKFSTR